MLDTKMKHCIAVHKLEPDLLAEAILGKKMECFGADDVAVLMRIAEGIGRLRRQADHEIHDNWYAASFDETASVLESLGFSMGWMDCRRSNACEEKETIWYRPDGLVAYLDSFLQIDVNRFELYCNYQPYSAESLQWLRNTNQNFRLAFPENEASPEENVYPLRFPVRDGVRRTIAALEEAGSFLPVWEKMPRLICANYDEMMRYRNRRSIWEGLALRKLSGGTPGLKQICAPALLEKIRIKSEA